MYRQGLGSITSPQSIHNSIITQLSQKSTIESDKITTQTLIISLNSMMGFAYLQRDNRTIMAKATKISVYEEINQLTGEVTYRQTTEFSERYGKPPVYVTTLESEITATQYADLKEHSLYEPYQRREIWFIDNESGREYRLTTRENTLSIEMYSKVINADYSLPQWLHNIVYQEDGKYIRDYTETKAKWREKQEAAIAARKAEIQAKKDAEVAERKRKAAEKKKAKEAERKAKKVAGKEAKKSATKANEKLKPIKPSKPATERKKREENISDMWSNWAKGK
nr:MAG TPA: hypothetical protein [Caudoviricetes sp.]